MPTHDPSMLARKDRRPIVDEEPVGGGFAESGAMPAAGIGDATAASELLVHAVERRKPALEH